MPFPPAAAQSRYQYPDNLDVPFVPTNQPTVEAMLRIANVGPGDFVIDLGSGDGRILITAARERGARGFGVDLDPRRVEESLENARAAGVADRVNFHRRNLFDTSIADATVVTMYLLPRVNLALRPR
ncbi:MAG: methyltransferase domain-containing protein, partial [Betaproteobacteria bacterium]|nr:methyltransferase domain-containing protein [Betaproteobacteria bacterium]